jgi:hypothetical protein
MSFSLTGKKTGKYKNENNVWSDKTDKRQVKTETLIGKAIRMFFFFKAYGKRKDTTY